MVPVRLENGARVAELPPVVVKLDGRASFQGAGARKPVPQYEYPNPDVGLEQWRRYVRGLADAVACRVMMVHHHELRAGLPPAAALATALHAVGADRAAEGARSDPAPLLCFGAGW